jgi:hypothetical protein
LLIRGGTVQPVSHRAEPLLAALDGALTLAEIERRFGAEGLSFVGLLFHKGLIELEGDTRS